MNFAGKHVLFLSVLASPGLPFRFEGSGCNAALIRTKLSVDPEGPAVGRSLPGGLGHTCSTLPFHSCGHSGHAVEQSTPSLGLSLVAFGSRPLEKQWV